MIIFRIIGAVGIALIVIGILMKKRKTQDLFFVLGGILLEIYSISVKDILFIVLQLIFTLASLYDFIKLSKGKCS